MSDPATVWLLWIFVQVDLGELQSAVREFVAGTTPVEVAMYGGGGLGSLFLTRWILKRRQSDDGPEPVPTSVSTTAGSGGGIAKDKAAVTLPSVLPISKGIREITHNEIHALELGLVVGAVSAWLFSLGRVKPVVTIVIVFVAGSLGFKRYSSKGIKTIRMEPWYALLALAAGGGIGWGIFVADPGVMELL